MKTVEIIKPIPLAQADGGDADGWKRSGQAALPDDEADEYERLGWIDIVDHGGVLVTWPACCGGGDHAHE